MKICVLVQEMHKQQNFCYIQTDIQNNENMFGNYRKIKSIKNVFFYFLVETMFSSI